MDNISQQNVLQKIEELREKQRQEEEKLLRQQEEQRKLLNIKQQKLYEILGLQKNGYEKLQNQIVLQSFNTKHCSGSSALDKRVEMASAKEISDVAKQTLDETPAANPNANFLQLLQDKLNELENNEINAAPNKGKPKQKFLRKGEGLARFRMKPDDFQLKSRNLNGKKVEHERKSELDQTSPKHSCSAMINARHIPYQSAIDKSQCLKEINPENYGFRVTSNSSKSHASWTAVQRKNHYSPGKDSIENSFLEKVEEAEKKSKKELEELKVFELLEEQAQNSSFCSNSSLFTRLMNDSIKSTPIKTQEDTKNKHLLLSNREDILAGSCFQNNELQLLYYQLNAEQENIAPKHENSFVYESKLKSRKQQDDEAAVNSLHVHFSDKNDYKSCSEEISCHSEASHSSDSGERELRLSDLRNRCDDFQDDDVWSDGCCTEFSKSRDSFVVIETVPTSSEANVDAEKKDDSKNIVNKANVCSLCWETIDKMEKKSMKEAGVNTELEDYDIHFHTTVLQTKLQDLEKEIEIFRKENTNLQKAQQQHQQEVATFSREKKDLENKMREEREQLESALQEERKKLQRQKMVFDKYCKETRKNPSKQEREEIQTLKQKVQELQEVIHKKNTKWSSFQARSREREKFLENENRRLKEELEVFKKIKATQKAKVIKHHQISKTKVLHAINDHIAKLTPDDLEDAIVIRDVIPKKVSPTFLTKFCATSTNDTNIPEEVNQHKVDTADKNLNSKQAYFGSPREHMMPLQNSETESHLSPVQSSNLDLSSQQVNKQESCTNTTNQKQDTIKSIASTYANYSYFLPQLSTTKTDSETDDQCKNDDPPVSKMLRSESQYDSVPSEKITDSNNVLSGSNYSTNNNTETEQVANKKVYQSQHVKINSSKSSESVMHENYDSLFAESLTPKNMANAEKFDVVEKITTEGGREKIYPDGRQEIWYANGNVKKISADRSTSKTIFYNGDVRERLSDGTVKYYFAETKVWQTTNPDGSELMEYSNGQVELRLADGTLKTTFPDLSVCTVYPDGRQKHVYKDGKVMEKNPLLGTEITSYPNGQREICSKDHMRLEYPDGTVKILYPDGLQETRYSNGRIRMKDKDGKLIMDSLQNETDSFNLQGSVT